MFFYFDWQVKLIISYLEDFLSSAKPLLNPATMAGFSSYNNTHRWNRIDSQWCVLKRFVVEYTGRQGAIVPKTHLGVAQLVARYLGVVEAASSSLVTQTKNRES